MKNILIITSVILLGFASCTKKAANLEGTVFKGTISSDLQPTPLTFTFKAGGAMDVLISNQSTTPGTYSISSDNKKITLNWNWFKNYYTVADLTDKCTKIDGTVAEDFAGIPTASRMLTVTKQ